MTPYQAARVREYVSEIVLSLEENGGVADATVVAAENDLYQYLDYITVI